MIDVSKYEKIGEFKDGRLHWLEGRDINAVYLIKFKEDFYIGSAEYVYIRIKEHTKSFLKGEHVEKMQSVFDEEKEFEVYVIEKGIDSTSLLTEEAKYIKQYSPTLNTIYATKGKSKIRDILEMKIALAGLTKKEVAERMGIQPQNINSTVLKNPKFEMLEKVADTLGVTVSELVGDAPASHINPQMHCPYCGHDLNIKVE